MKLSTQHLLPDSTVDNIACELHNINYLNQLYVKEYMKQTLAGNDVAPGTTSADIEALDDGDMVKQCLDEGGTFHTKAKRSAFVRQNFVHVRPQSIYVGNDERCKCHYAYYVPLRESLEALMLHKSVAEQCMAVPVSIDDVLKDLSDGSVYQNK